MTKGGKEGEDRQEEEGEGRDNQQLVEENGAAEDEGAPAMRSKETSSADAPAGGGPTALVQKEGEEEEVEVVVDAIEESIVCVYWDVSIDALQKAVRQKLFLLCVGGQAGWVAILFASGG